MISKMGGRGSDRPLPGQSGRTGLGGATLSRLDSPEGEDGKRTSSSCDAWAKVVPQNPHSGFGSVGRATVAKLTLR